MNESDMIEHNEQFSSEVLEMLSDEYRAKLVGLAIHERIELMRMCNCDIVTFRAVVNAIRPDIAHRMKP